MKYIIHKNPKNAPKDLEDYRLRTPNARYDGGNFSVPGLKNALLKEQGYLCAYCMKKISLQEAQVEHFLPQATYPEEDLKYMNMLAVCKGFFLFQAKK